MKSVSSGIRHPLTHTTKRPVLPGKVGNGENGQRGGWEGARDQFLKALGGSQLQKSIFHLQLFPISAKHLPHPHFYLALGSLNVQLYFCIFTVLSARTTKCLWKLQIAILGYHQDHHRFSHCHLPPGRPPRDRAEPFCSPLPSACHRPAVAGAQARCVDQQNSVLVPLRLHHAGRCPHQALSPQP